MTQPDRGTAATKPSSADTTPVALSIIIPAYNEERRLPDTLRAIAAWVEGHDRAVEVVVVENGSTDRTVEVVEAFQAQYPFIQLVQGLPPGKGRAVREGMLAATGERRLLCDADLSMPIGEAAKFLPPHTDGVDVVVGSREVPGARRIGEPAHRHVMGRAFNLIVKAVALPGIEDSQCGFKLFTAPAAERVFRLARLKGWGFDPEVLYIARKHGYRLRELPIEWHFNADSRVRPVHDSLAMVRDLFRIRIYDWRGYYDD
jgi:dolichyl-phosphate beta-glucosyltransferase